MPDHGTRGTPDASAMRAAEPFAWNPHNQAPQRPPRVLSKAEIGEAVSRLHGEAEAKRERIRQADDHVRSREKAHAVVTQRRPTFSSAEEMANAIERMHADAEKSRQRKQEMIMRQDAAAHAMRFIGRKQQMSEGERRRSFDRLYENAMLARDQKREAELRRSGEFEAMYREAVAERARMIRGRGNVRRPAHRKAPERPPEATQTDVGFHNEAEEPLGSSPDDAVPDDEGDGTDSDSSEGDENAEREPQDSGGGAAEDDHASPGAGGGDDSDPER